MSLNLVVIEEISDNIARDLMEEYGLQQDLFYPLVEKIQHQTVLLLESRSRRPGIEFEDSASESEHEDEENGKSSSAYEPYLIQKAAIQKIHKLLSKISDLLPGKLQPADANAKYK